MSYAYIDPLRDYGFKLLFGQKAVLIAMLNALLPPEDRIADLTYVNTEVVGPTPIARAIVYDLHCVTLDGRHIIVEVQQASHAWFKDRCLHYVSRAFDGQVLRGSGSYELQPVYLVAVMDFALGLSGGDFLSVVELRDARGALFTDKLRFYFLDLTKLDLMSQATDLPILEQWMRAVKTMGYATEVPSWVTDEDLRRAYAAAEVNNLSEAERVAYERSLRDDLDRRGEMLAKWIEGKELGWEEGRVEGREEGREEGRAEGREEGDERRLVLTIRQLTDKGLTPAAIAELLDLPRSKVETVVVAHRPDEPPTPRE